MKLIDKEEAVRKYTGLLNIPPAYELVHCAYSRNSQPDEMPYFMLELEWDPEGGLKTQEEEETRPAAVRVELDACTGKLISLYRHDLKPEQEAAAKGKNEPLDESLRAAVDMQVERWLERLELNINPAELKIHKAMVKNDGRYRVHFGRQHNGIPVASYQTLDFDFNERWELIHFLCRWDDCTFEKADDILPAERLLARFGPQQLTLAYIMLLSDKYPYYSWLEDEIHAVTGEVVRSENDGVTAFIDLNSVSAEDVEGVEILHVPVISTANYEALRLSDEARTADPSVEHPFAPRLSEKEAEAALKRTAGYLKAYHGDEPYQFAYVYNKNGHPAEGFQGNQIKIDVQRFIHGVPIMGGRIRIVLDRAALAVRNVADGLEMHRLVREMRLKQEGETDFSLQEASSGTSAFHTPLFDAAAAWERLKDKLDLQLCYLFLPPKQQGELHAVPVYKISSNWVFNAVTGDASKLK